MPSKEREGIPNCAIQNGFDRTAVSSVTALADNNQRVTLANERSNVLQRVLHDAKTGILQPALETALAGSILVVCIQDNRILTRFFRCIGYRIAKVMNDYLHRLASPFWAKSIESVLMISATKIHFYIIFHFNNIIGDIK